MHAAHPSRLLKRAATLNAQAQSQCPMPNAQCPILAVGTVPRWHDLHIISQDSQSGPLDIHRNDEQDRVYNLSSAGRAARRPATHERINAFGCKSMDDLTRRDLLALAVGPVLMQTGHRGQRRTGYGPRGACSSACIRPAPTASTSRRRWKDTREPASAPSSRTC